MGVNRLKELEEMLLDQVEKLNDDSIADDLEATQKLIDRSKAMEGLADQIVEINRLKLDVVKEMNSNGGLYENYLGIEDNTLKG